MAEAKDEKEKDPRAERRSKMYDNPRSKSARGDDDKEPATEREGHADVHSADKGHLAADGILGKHAEEREGMRKAHEGEHRDRHTRHRDERRTMAKKHEEEHAGVTDHAKLAMLHRQQEHEHGQMSDRHDREHGEMTERHHREIHDLNMRHEAEVQGAAAAPTEAAAGNEGPAEVQAA